MGTDAKFDETRRHTTELALILAQGQAETARGLRWPNSAAPRAVNASSTM